MTPRWRRSTPVQLCLALHWRHNGAIASQITSLTIVYSTAYSDAYQRKQQSSASLAFVKGIHRWPATRWYFCVFRLNYAFHRWTRQGIYNTLIVVDWYLRLAGDYTMPDSAEPRLESLGLLSDTQNCVLRMRRECRERFPRHRFQGKWLVNYPGMRHRTCVTHVPWCMSGSLTRGGGENVLSILGACAARTFAYLVRGPFVAGIDLPYQGVVDCHNHKCVSHGNTVVLH